METEVPTDKNVLIYKTPLGFAIITVVLSAVFVMGLLISYLVVGPIRRDLRGDIEQLQRKNAQLSGTNAELEKRAALLQRTLRMAELRGAVGLMSYRANRDNYSAAADLSTGFFDGLRETTEKTDNQALKHNLQKILDQRDQVTAALATGDPKVKDRLARIYADFFQIRSTG
jgi:cell division protein FtsB